MSKSLSPSDASSNWRSKANIDSLPSPSSFPGKKQRFTGNYHSRQQPAFHSGANFESRPFEPSNAKKSLPVQKAEDHRENDSGALQAIEEGRRLYVGNLPYMAKEQDVLSLFGGDGYSVKRIDISIDPFTARNLSYCFVDLGSREEATRAMADLNQREFLGRPLKIGPGKAKKGSRPPLSSKPIPLVFEGWRESNASDHWEGYAAQGRRLYVGGLPTMASHRVVNENIRELFRGFQLEAVSKMISPSVHRPGPRNHFYVFVDFTDATEAGQAAEKLDGTLAFGGRIRVSEKDGRKGRKGIISQYWSAMTNDPEYD
ncbi:RNA-binding domain-containing protein [Guyanagaster necrorhizus]|uniref:RNA-binding domain-containing protein n=1 Tax=Guyanagaster necrorhizus TaxID=856835 RepID=A0A9P8AR98_9AGAR|nr:RNA-binding domain-containing protein [Guyanagaster necrorhizus MCA 3950]KAG7443647.1 RNA-binding domain-containing protein [Guyanagaster necrorhizus MCA 3950]